MNTRGPHDDPWSNITTRIVEAELRNHDVPVPGWVEVVDESLDELVSLADWFDRIGAGAHNRGEASVLNLAESRSGIAVIDDGDARRVGGAYGVETHGVLWVIAQQVVRGECSEGAAEALVSALMETGARYPFEPGGYCTWAHKSGLLS